MIDSIVVNAPLFLLIAVRCFALLMTLPLFSMQIVPRTAKIALTGYMAFLIFPYANFPMYEQYISPTGLFNLSYVFLLIGEGMIGVIMGFYITILFSAFSAAGQFFAFQMGLSASEVYDVLTQVENPVMGQYFNFAAMLVFLQNKWFQKIFLKGLYSSFETMNVFKLLDAKEGIVKFLLGSLTKLFADALVIALPIMGTLILINICIGILGRAAPQMHLLAEGFPTILLVSFFVIAIIVPQLVDFFERSFNVGVTNLITNIIGGGT